MEKIVIDCLIRLYEKLLQSLFYKINIYVEFQKEPEDRTWTVFCDD